MQAVGAAWVAEPGGSTCFYWNGYGSGVATRLWRAHLQVDDPDLRQPVGVAFEAWQLHPGADVRERVVSVPDLRPNGHFRFSLCTANSSSSVAGSHQPRRTRRGRRPTEPSRRFFCSSGRCEGASSRPIMERRPQLLKKCEVLTAGVLSTKTLGGGRAGGGCGCGELNARKREY